MSQNIRWHVVTVIIAAAVALGWIAFWLWNAKALPTLSDTYRIKAEVPSAVAIAPRASVRIAGLTVGQVKGIERKGNTAVLDLQIDDEDHEPIPVDSRIGVRLRTLVGENYVDLYPGRSRTSLPDGATLPISRANDYVEVDAILSVLRGETREQARKFIQGLGYGVKDRGRQLNRSVAGASTFIDDGSAMVRTLANDRKQVARLVENFGDVARAIGERGSSLREMARGMRTTFQSIARRDSALRSTLSQMPATLRQIRETSGVVRTLTRDGAPVLANLDRAVRELKPSVKLLKPAADEGRGVLQELGRSAQPLSGTLKRVTSLSGPTAAAMPALRRALCEANPTLKTLAPFSLDVATLFSTFLSGGGNYYDAVGHALRLSVYGGEDSIALLTPPMRDAMQLMLESGFMAEAHKTGYNPFPGPGGAVDLKTGENITGPEKWPHKYQRVQAECGIKTGSN